MHPYDGRVVSNFIRQALNGEDITIYGDGSQTRSFQCVLLLCFVLCCFVLVGSISFSCHVASVLFVCLNTFFCLSVVVIWFEFDVCASASACVFARVCVYVSAC